MANELIIQISLEGETLALDTLATHIAQNWITELKIYNEADNERIKWIMRVIAQSLTKYSALTHLEFVDCLFTSDGAVSIAKELPSCSSLTTIIISAKYDDTGAKALADAISTMPSVTTVLQWAPFCDLGMEAVISLIEKNPNLVALGASDAIIGAHTYQKLMKVLQYNFSISHFAFPKILGYIQLDWIYDCFVMNSTLVSAHGSSPEFMHIFSDFKRWFTQVKEICHDMSVGITLRDSVPPTLLKEKDIRALLSKIAKQSKDISGIKIVDSIVEPQVQEISRLHNRIAQLTERHKEEVSALLERYHIREKRLLGELQRLREERQVQLVQFQEHQSQTEIRIKKNLAKAYLREAFKMLDHAKPTEAKCFLKIATDLDQFEDFVHLGTELQAQIEEQLKLTEIERHTQIEARIAANKEGISHAEQQATKVRSEEEREMINEQVRVLQKQVKKLEKRCQVFEKQQKEIREREIQLEQQETLLKEQTKHLGELLAELTASGEMEPLVQQMLAVSVGDKDVDAARQRFSSLQKSARDAQQKLREEEKRQRERVEWLQKQIELYQIKGMSPAQLSFRNYLKDVKRLSVVRHQIEHTPFPLRCFISYAWELDAGTNKNFQIRLQRLKDELEMAGMKVALDICDMKDDMRQFMVQNIQTAHKLLLICTPRLKDRATEVAKNNLQLELETAMIKSQTTREFVVPLLFSGTFRDAMPTQVQHLLAINLKSQETHFSAMASVAPMGLIPMLLGLERNKDYKRIHDRQKDIAKKERNLFK
eukprot:Phypoly_transcript_03174.p1 GENE.Phypoly_transcript_03174~~Phypoly_transcript_03174.p1  ORF type:complete len:777 (+),score=137.16 Phypoly_transcript_03174:25-2331(+)